MIIISQIGSPISQKITVKILNLLKTKIYVFLRAHKLQLRVVGGGPESALVRLRHEKIRLGDVRPMRIVVGVWATEALFLTGPENTSNCAIKIKVYTLKKFLLLVYNFNFFKNLYFKVII